MSNPKPRVTVVGLGQVGGSIGLALRQAEVASLVVGHDREPTHSKKAQKLGAVDKTHWNLISACEESSLVVLATPLGAIEETLKAVGLHLQPGCVVVDTASLKAPVMNWAAEFLPEGIHFVGGNPIVARAADDQGGLEAARADLFKDGLFCLVPSPTARPEAVKLAADLVTILGAKPLFLDAVEHDGLQAAVDLLPSALSLALLDAVVQQPSWRESRKLAGVSFETGTYLLSQDPSQYSELLFSNRENLVRWVDTFSASLATLRRALVEGTPEELAERFEGAMRERNKWLQDRAAGQWEEGSGQVDMPEKPNFLIDTFFGGLWRRDKERDKKRGN